MALKHVQHLDFSTESADIVAMKFRSANSDTQPLAIQLLVFVVIVVAAFYLGAAIL